MIRAKFFKRDGSAVGFEISGHSGLSHEGSDIVCAAVSAMVMMACNIVTDSLKLPSTVDVDEDKGCVSLRIDSDSNGDGAMILTALKRELEALSAEYPQNIQVKE